MKYPSQYHTFQIDGLSIFYREAGLKKPPTLLLLHGFARDAHCRIRQMGNRQHQAARQHEPAAGHRDRRAAGCLLASIGRPAAQGAIQALMARGFHKPGDVEDRVGYYLAQIARWQSERSAWSRSIQTTICERIAR